MIEIKERVEIPGDPATTWGLIRDPYTVAACVPGCELADQREDGSYNATIAIKFGGIRVRFRAIVFIEMDDDSRKGSIRGTGAAQQGGTQVAGEAEFMVSKSADGGSVIDIKGEVKITGRLSGVISSGASFVIKRMSRDFTENLTARAFSN